MGDKTLRVGGRILPDNGGAVLKPSPDESRRDRMAANAMQALVSRFGNLSPDAPGALNLAKAAYAYADAMLAARAQK